MMRLHCEERKNLKNFLQQKKKSRFLLKKGPSSRPQDTKNKHAYARTSTPSAEANDQTTTGEGEEEDEVEAGVQQEGDESEASKAKAAGSSLVVVAALAAGCAVVAALLLCTGLRLCRHSKTEPLLRSSGGDSDGEFVSKKRSSGDIKWTSNPGPVHRSLDI